MPLTKPFLLLIFTIIVASLIWARIKLFKVRSKSSKTGSLLYDPIVAIQIVSTFYHFGFSSFSNLISPLLAFVFYSISLSLFWWGVQTVNQLDFAFSNNVGKIVTSGPFSIIRHPFYLSYILCWITSTVLFNSIELWITLLYLIAFYSISAKTEEKVIMKSEYSIEYESYRNNIGMFLPRVKQWKSWLLKILKQSKR